MVPIDGEGGGAARFERGGAAGVEIAGADGADGAPVGLESKPICAGVGADATTVSKRRRQFAAQRPNRLLDEPRPGTLRKTGDDAPRPSA